MSKVKVAVIGASGYMGEELVRILLRHPQVELACVTSRQYAGQPLRSVFPRYYEASQCFSEPDVEAIADGAEVAFLALPHGLAAEYAVPLIEKGLRVIDVSADFRVRDPAVYEEYYETEHPAPELLKQAVYGLPERYREEIAKAQLVATPGCYPTSMLIPGIALLASGLASPKGIVVASMSGVSGTGRKTDVANLFSECNESLRPYKVTKHRHLSEVEQELALASGADETPINFIPHLVPVTRGIHTTMLFNTNGKTTAGDVQALLAERYRDEPFVRVLGEGELADTKHVTMTNFCEIGVAYEPRNRKIVVSSAIDNLTKGGSGQAVQCFNIINGFDEGAGLV